MPKLSRNLFPLAALVACIFTAPAFAASASDALDSAIDSVRSAASQLSIPAPAIVGIHLGTWHSDKSLNLCDNTPGGYAEWASGFTIGAYKNSECSKSSAYAGWTWNTAPVFLFTSPNWSPIVRASLTAGVVTGYRDKPIAPLLLPSLIVSLPADFSLRLTYIPNTRFTHTSAVNFAIEVSLW